MTKFHHNVFHSFERVARDHPARSAGSISGPYRAPTSALKVLAEAGFWAGASAIMVALVFFGAELARAIAAMAS